MRQTPKATLANLSLCRGDDSEDQIVGAKLTELQELIHNRQLARIETLDVTDTEVESVLDLCLRTADEHPEAMERLLLGHDNVREAALRRLAAEARSSENEQLCLLKSFLNVGIWIKDPSTLSSTAIKFLETRKEQKDTYWGNKQKKHIGVKLGKNDDWAFKKGKPFFYKTEGYSTKNYNGRLGPVDHPFVCRHLTAALDGLNNAAVKTALRNIAEQDVTSFNYEALEDAYSRKLELSSINFSPYNFGKLMIRLSRELKHEEEQSFIVLYRGELGHHAMRVFLERQANGKIKLGLYVSHPG